MNDLSKSSKPTQMFAGGQAAAPVEEKDKTLVNENGIKRFHRRRDAEPVTSSPQAAPVQDLDADFEDDELPDTQLPLLMDIEPAAEGAKSEIEPPSTIPSKPAREDRLLVEPAPQLPSRIAPLWDRIPRISIDVKTARKRRMPWVDLFRASDSAKAVDLLRTRLLHTLRAQGWKRVAIASPTSGGGATFSTINLAQSLARVPDSRTLVMDMNFRTPGVAQALGMSATGDMAELLQGKTRPQDHLLRVANGLAVGLNGAKRTDAAEILHGPQTADVIDQMVDETRADVALFDLAPVLEHDDLSAFLPQVDGVLLIADGTRTTAKDLAACEKILSGHTQLLGVVLNRARAA